MNESGMTQLMNLIKKSVSLLIGTWNWPLRRQTPFISKTTLTQHLVTKLTFSFGELRTNCSQLYRYPPVIKPFRSNPGPLCSKAHIAWTKQTDTQWVTQTINLAFCYHSSKDTKDASTEMSLSFLKESCGWRQIFLTVKMTETFKQ